MIKKHQTNRGQALIELLIGMTVAIVFIAGAVGVIVVSMRLAGQSKFSLAANELTHEAIDQISTFSDANWHNIFDAAAHDGTTQYHLEPSGGFYTLSSGAESITMNSKEFSRSFTIEDTYRDENGEITDENGIADPSTLKITVSTTWLENNDTAVSSKARYLTRNKNRVFNQTNWSGGPNQEGPIVAVNNLFSTSTNINFASTSGSIYIASLSAGGATSSNIDVVEKWAWNDVIGWIDFAGTAVTVSTTKLFGYASSSIGAIALDCTTAPIPNCTFPYQVNNDGAGILSGWAWNDVIGWISFSSSSATSTYGVSIDGNGYFSGWAWNDVIGWISFNCSNTGTCGTSNYKVKTSWGSSITAGSLTSSIFDTQISGGAGFNSLIWQGSLPVNTLVKFQIASANDSSGPWNYLGSDGTALTYYQSAGPDVPIKINRSSHNNHRYIRYRVFLESNPDRTQTPRIDDIIINWAP